MAVTLPLPPIDLLRKLFRYEQETGKLYWLPRTPDMFNDKIKKTKEHECNRWNKRYAYKESGIVSNRGYISIRYNRKSYQGHRIIWVLYYGYEPCFEPDHINGIKTDNRISNLREATRSEQCTNVPIYKNNTSGMKGVSWSKTTNKWCAYITKNGKRKHLGSFDKLQDAATARKTAEEKYHGQYARKDESPN